MPRVARIRKMLVEKGLDGVYVSSSENRAYFSGFTGSNGHLFVTTEQSVLITDPRYTEQASDETNEWTIVTHGLNAMATIKEQVSLLGAVKIGYETNKLTDAECVGLKRELPEIEWIPLHDYGLEFRSVKDDEELRRIKTAIHIADRALIRLAENIAPGMSEREIQIELEYLMALEGSEGPAFGTIVASGPRSSLPHGTATDKRVVPGEMIVIDCGATYKGYRSDITRTLWVEVPEPEILGIFHIVLKSQDAALKAIKPGMTCGDIDRIHRDVFEREGMEPYSLRGLGHGVGLHIHELPRVVMGSSEKIVPGMVFTVEPGLYVPGVGGVRIEDIVRVTEDGCEVLTNCPKILQVHGDGQKGAEKRWSKF